jgi:hypothetical protein
MAQHPLVLGGIHSFRDEIVLGDHHSFKVDVVSSASSSRQWLALDPDERRMLPGVGIPKQDQEHANNASRTQEAQHEVPPM